MVKSVQDQIIGDQMHMDHLTSHFRTFDPDKIHLHMGIDVIKAQFGNPMA